MTESKLQARLADQLLAAHPERAAIALERQSLESSVALLCTTSAEHLARVVPLLSPQFCGDILRALPDEQVGEMLDSLSSDTAARLARLLGDQAERVLAAVKPVQADAIRSLLRYPADTAGGLMDPSVLALPRDLTAAEALDRIRAHSQNARYNLYVVDRDQRLVGVLNLRELFLAEPSVLLGDLMVANPQRLLASVGRASIVSDPGWRTAHALPVVDDQGRYLGAIRYKTLRSLEDAIHHRKESEPAQALGELFSVGAGGVVRAFLATGTREDG
jgi:magnesium transporter